MGVDVQNSSGSTCNVGWTATGEMLTYRAGNAGGSYDIGVRHASTQNGRRIRVEINGNSAGVVSTDGNGWQSYSTEIIHNVAVPSNATITVTFLDGSANLDYLNFTLASAPPPQPTATPQPTVPPQPTITPQPTPPPSSDNCTHVALKERREISLHNSDCVTFSQALNGRTLAIWDSDANPSCDFRGTVTSVDGLGSVNVNKNYVASSALTGRTVRLYANNNCRFLKVRFY